MTDEYPPVVVEHYKGKDAHKLYEGWVGVWAKRGYVPINVVTSGGGFSAGHILAFGIAGLAARKETVLTVTYKREAAT